MIAKYIHDYVEFASAHPEIVTLIIYPVATAVLTFFFKPRTKEEMETLHKERPFFAKVIEITSRAGVDVPGLVDAITRNRKK
jgi:hypothetical protein